MFTIQGQVKTLNSRNTCTETTPKKGHQVIKKKKSGSTTYLPQINSNKKKINKNVSSDKTKERTTKKVVVLKTPVLKVETQKKLTITEEAEKLLSEEENKELNGTGHVKVRFNHYNKAFPIHNGVLQWTHVDEEYCISFVFKGNYTRELKQELSVEGRNIEVSESNAKRDESGKYFLGLTANATDPITYRLMIEEDPEAGVGAEGLRIRAGPLSFEKEEKCIQSGNNAVNDITQSLLSMKTSDLHSQEANDLRERRDLEDILYS